MDRHEGTQPTMGTLFYLFVLLHILEILNYKGWCPAKDNSFLFLYQLLTFLRHALLSSFFYSLVPKNRLVDFFCGAFTRWYYAPSHFLLEEPLLSWKGGSYMEVALVFVIVLQGFETFVHRSRDFATQISNCGRSFNKRSSVTSSSQRLLLALPLL